MKESGRARYVAVTNDEAMAALVLLAKQEGIIPALEPAHALAAAGQIAPTLGRNDILLVTLSGRGDKDLGQVFSYLESHVKP